MPPVEQPKSVQPDNYLLELEFRHYQEKLGYKKILYGTMIVGLASVAIPNSVSIFNYLLEDRRKSVEQGIVLESANQQYVKEFFTSAINQDIGLRIRFAEYFEYLSPLNTKERVL